MMANKNKVVKDNTGGIEFLFKKNKIDWLKGKGRLSGKNEVTVEGDGGAEVIGAKNIIIATGSESIPVAGVEVDEQRIVTSTGALELTEVPKRFAVIGGGVIGLELASVWGRLGAEVTVIEYLDRILPGLDGEVSKQMQRILGKQGFTFKLGMKVTGAAAGNSGITLTVEPSKGGEPQQVEADVVLVAIGRRPYTDGLGLEEMGIEVNGRGRIVTDAHWQTNVPGVYAIGDVIEGQMLAHKAEDEGVAVAEFISGQ